MTWSRKIKGDAKPHIKKNSQGLWWCRDKATYGSGWGTTVKAAYDDWCRKVRDAKRFTIQRAGIWNKKSCLDWFRSGCPPISSYIGSRQIVSYVPATDTLILRGAV